MEPEKRGLSYHIVFLLALIQMLTRQEYPADLRNRLRPLLSHRCRLSDALHGL